MSILTTIGGMPLFSTQQEALQWASSNGLNGLHAHVYQGQTGYMGGSSHATAAASQRLNGGNQTTSTPATNSGSGNTGGY
jgi:hypothetical protein